MPWQDDGRQGRKAARPPGAPPATRPSPNRGQSVGGRRLHCSANERRADEASRDVEAWLKCRFMREHLGEEFAGTVSVASFGLFVHAGASCTSRGLVHISRAGGEYYHFDEVRQELRGERTGIRYAVGTKVRVQVSRVDLDGRKIDFRLVRRVDPGARCSQAGCGTRGPQKASATRTRAGATRRANRSAPSRRWMRCGKTSGKTAAKVLTRHQASLTGARSGSKRAGKRSRRPRRAD